MNSPSSGWIGVDFDGTLAHYDGSGGIDALGHPVESMMFRVQQWLEAGIEVRIFTARASVPELVPSVKNWLRKHSLPDLVVTNRRDYELLQLWDDRAIQLAPNTAELLTPREHIRLSVQGWIGVELDGTLAHYEPAQSLDSIGEPIGKMRARVQQWLMVGMDVRLFTPRATDPVQIPRIRDWLEAHQLGAMKVTCEKDFAMFQFWDDCAIHVVTNTGRVTGHIGQQLLPPRKYP